MVRDGSKHRLGVISSWMGVTDFVRKSWRASLILYKKSRGSKISFNRESRTRLCHDLLHKEAIGNMHGKHRSFAEESSGASL